MLSPPLHFDRCSPLALLPLIQQKQSRCTKVKVRLAQGWTQREKQGLLENCVRVCFKLFLFSFAMLGSGFYKGRELVEARKRHFEFLQLSVRLCLSIAAMRQKGGNENRAVFWVFSALSFFNILRCLTNVPYIQAIRLELLFIPLGFFFNF